MVVLDCLGSPSFHLLLSRRQPLTLFRDRSCEDSCLFGLLLILIFRILLQGRSSKDSSLWISFFLCWQLCEDLRLVNGKHFNCIVIFPLFCHLVIVVIIVIIAVQEWTVLALCGRPLLHETFSKILHPFLLVHLVDGQDIIDKTELRVFIRVCNR